jgi:hypothetical protein
VALTTPQTRHGMCFPVAGPFHLRPPAPDACAVCRCPALNTGCSSSTGSSHRPARLAAADRRGGTRRSTGAAPNRV